MKEKETYRQNLEMLTKAFNGKGIISVSELASWMEVDKRTIRKHMKDIITPAGISIVNIAWYLS